MVGTHTIPCSSLNRGQDNLAIAENSLVAFMAALPSGLKTHARVVTGEREDSWPLE